MAQITKLLSNRPKLQFRSPVSYNKCIIKFSSQTGFLKYRMPQIFASIPADAAEL